MVSIGLPLKFNKFSALLLYVLLSLVVVTQYMMGER